MHVRIMMLVLLASGLLAACSGPTPDTTPTPVPVVRTDTRVVAEARVVPAFSANLSAAGGGVAMDVPVKEGDKVSQGQLLLQLDARRANAGVAQAEADLARAQASLAKLKAGATPEEISIAEAQLARAEAQSRQTSGSVTESDLAAAEARLRQVTAELQRVRRGARASDVAASQARLEQARASQLTERDRLSEAKTQAQLQVDQAASALTQAQSSYSTALQNWQYVQDTGNDPVQPKTVDSKGRAVPNKLNDTQRQQYYDAFIQAQAALASAEAGVEQATVTFNTARQAEVNGNQAAEQQVAEAQAMLETTRASVDPDQIAAAQARVASAQADLDKLKGDQRTGSLDVAQASVAEARANLAMLQSGPSREDLALAAADIQRAEAALVAAQASLAELELRAPFAGIVAAIDLKPGEYVMPGKPVFQLGDSSAWLIETTDLTELNVVQVQPGALAKITFDAIPDLELTGKVTRVKALGENRQGDITYTVVITPDTYDARLRWNMTASVVIDAR